MALESEGQEGLGSNLSFVRAVKLRTWQLRDAGVCPRVAREGGGGVTRGEGLVTPGGRLGHSRWCPRERPRFLSCWSVTQRPVTMQRAEAALRAGGAGPARRRALRLQRRRSRCVIDAAVIAALTGKRLFNSHYFPFAKIIKM